MPYIYLASIMSAGILAVLWLALRTEARRLQSVNDALARLPGIEVDKTSFYQGKGLAIDEQAHALCLVRADAHSVRVQVSHFADILASELWMDGRLVSRVQRGDPPHGAGVYARQQTATAGVQLCIEVADRQAPRHVLDMPGLKEAVRWQSYLRHAVLPAPALAPRSASAHPDTEQSADRPSGYCSNAAAPGSDQAVDSPVEAVLQYLREQLSQRNTFVVSERKLRDASAADLSLIRFHEHMNRWRRQRTLQGFKLSYSRKDETWRIRRVMTAS